METRDILISLIVSKCNLQVAIMEEFTTVGVLLVFGLREGRLRYSTRLKIRKHDAIFRR
jgi:hypothetical protein